MGAKRNRSGRRIMLRVTSEQENDRVLVSGLLSVDRAWWGANATYAFIRARGVTDDDILAIEKLRNEIVQHLHGEFRAWLRKRRAP